MRLHRPLIAAPPAQAAISKPWSAWSNTYRGWPTPSTTTSVHDLEPPRRYLGLSPSAPCQPPVAAADHG
jgi:hypothetical protein